MKRVIDDLAKRMDAAGLGFDDVYARLKKLEEQAATRH
jgi:hypothetical protein